MTKADQYPIFRHWYQCLIWILERTEQFPKSSRQTISVRIEVLSLDIIDLITEAIYTPAKSRRHVLKKINIQLDKLRILFRLCHDRKFISTKQYEYISRMIDETGKMTGGWLKTL